MLARAKKVPNFFISSRISNCISLKSNIHPAYVYSSTDKKIDFVIKATLTVTYQCEEAVEFQFSGMSRNEIDLFLNKMSIKIPRILASNLTLKFQLRCPNLLPSVREECDSSAAAPPHSKASDFLWAFLNSPNTKFPRKLLCKKTKRGSFS